MEPEGTGDVTMFEDRQGMDDEDGSKEGEFKGYQEKDLKTFSADPTGEELKPDI